MKLGHSFFLLAVLWGVGVSEARELGDRQVSCRVLGYDVSIVNESDSVLEEGISVTWFVPFDQARGQHTLRSPLNPGEARLLAGSLSNFLSTDASCEAHLNGELDGASSEDIPSVSGD